VNHVAARVAVLSVALLVLAGCSSPSDGGGTDSGEASASDAAPSLTTVACPDAVVQGFEASDASTFDISGTEWTPSTAPSCVLTYTGRLLDGNNEDYSVEVVLADYVTVFAYWASPDDLEPLFAEAQSAVAAAGVTSSQSQSGFDFSTPQATTWVEGRVNLVEGSELTAEYGLDPGVSLFGFEITTYIVRT